MSSCRAGEVKKNPKATDGNATESDRRKKDLRKYSQRGDYHAIAFCASSYRLRDTCRQASLPVLPPFRWWKTSARFAIDRSFFFPHPSSDFRLLDILLVDLGEDLAVLEEMEFLCKEEGECQGMSTSRLHCKSLWQSWKLKSDTARTSISHSSAMEGGTHWLRHIPDHIPPDSNPAV